MNPRRLYRSRDRQLAGVAGGMAEYLDIDPTVVRIVWIILGVVSGGLALVAYVILALVMPQAPYATAPGGWAPTPAATGAASWTPPPGGAGAAAWGPPPAAPAAPAWGTAPAPIGGWSAGAYAAPQVPPRTESRGIGAAAIVGVVLVVFGAIALADAALPGWAAGAIIGPAVILALGAALLASSLRRRPDAAQAAPLSAPASAPAAAPAEAASATAPWDATDTQAVSSDEGSRPA